MNEAVVELLERNAAHADAFEDSFGDLQDGQRPDAVTICCSDSRVLQDHMWGNDEPGRVFTCSNIGNRVVQRTRAGTTVSGDVLYPIVHTGTDTAIVVGHTGCGAVTATYDALTGAVSEPPGIEHCIALLERDIAGGIDALPEDVARPVAINRLVEYNVDRQVESLLACDAIPDDVTAVGAVYDFQDVYGGRRGEVHVVNVDGETDPAALRDAYPEIAARVRRLWTY
ncbi:MAG: carbonic anhydrase [Halobacteriaceae archaeon]